jgi:hypothetical protein
VSDVVHCSRAVPDHLGASVEMAFCSERGPVELGTVEAV